MRNCMSVLTLCVIGVAWLLAGTSGCSRSQPKPVPVTSSNGTSATQAASRDIDFADRQAVLDATAMIERSLSAPDTAEMTPAEVVAMLTRLHQVQSRTREWEMLDFVGKRDWEELARRVASRHPQAVRDAIRNGSPIESELMHVLAQVGGKQNALLLVRQFQLHPTLDNVIALGRVDDPETFPMLRSAMELDDPVEAAKYLDAAEDEAVKTNIPLANEPAEKLAEETALKVAEWYVALAGRAGAGGRELMVARAQSLYRRFFRSTRTRTT